MCAVSRRKLHVYDISTVNRTDTVSLGRNAIFAFINRGVALLLLGYQCTDVGEKNEGFCIRGNWHWHVKVGLN